MFAITIMVGAVVLIFAYQIGRSVALGKVHGARVPSAAAGAVWDTFLQGLRTMLVIVAGAAVILLAALNSVFRPVGLEDRLDHRVAMGDHGPGAPTRPRRAGSGARRRRSVHRPRPRRRRRSRRPRRRPLRHLQGRRGAPAPGSLPPVAEEIAVERATRRRDRRGHGGRRLRRGARGGLTAAFRSSSEAAAVGKGCNGSAKLCDRPLADVALPAAHNAMSAADGPGSSSRTRIGIPQQLDDGARGLLIDAH